MKTNPVIAVFFKQFDTQKNIPKNEIKSYEKKAVDSLFGKLSRKQDLNV